MYCSVIKTQYKSSMQVIYYNFISEINVINAVAIASSMLGGWTCVLSSSRRTENTIKVIRSKWMQNLVTIEVCD